MANEKTPVVWDDTTKKHRPLGSGEKMGGLSASSMISSDSGNLLQQGSDGLMLVTGGSIADPRADNLLEESDNGKLQVTSDRVVEWLEGHPQAAAAIAEAVKVVSGDSGNVITAGTDKGAFMSKSTLASAVSTMSAAQLTTLANALRKQGGGLSVGSDGKLSVDFGSMDPAIMRNVVLSMVQQGGGIAVDGSGKLYVDFDSMPTDKFEALLKSLKMQVPLSATMNLYVDQNSAAASDTIVDGRGTEAKPFKTVQACINFLTQNYAMGRYDAHILVKPGTYSEALTLPTFTRTSGSVYVQAHNEAAPPIFVNPYNTATMALCTGGTWRLRRLTFRATRTASNNGLANFPETVTVTGGGAALVLYGCTLSETYTGAAPSSGYTYIRMINSRNGASAEMGLMHDYGNVLDFHKGNANSLTVYNIERGGKVAMSGTSDSENVVDIECSGEMTLFVGCSGQSLFTDVGGGLYAQHFIVPDGASVTGSKYSAVGGSGIDAPSDGLPGDVEGTVDSSTCGWYKV